MQYTDAQLKEHARRYAMELPGHEAPAAGARAAIHLLCRRVDDLREELNERPAKTRGRFDSTDLLLGVTAGFAGGALCAFVAYSFAWGGPLG